ncbi:tetratricopeptide repeat protein [Vibrio tritonius]|uniref:tetratricopeptide repeat protein n=1 Tax=Vibrio tritonius TaxID=1435069 RepID=UPI0008384D71|nr:tetratricopeptide repeat protein [Vibrio tritonius]
MVYKLTSYLFLALVLSGCTSLQDKGTHLSDETNEKVFISTGNYPKLIEFYKKQLKDDEDSKTRIKLVNAYERVNDYSSAIFYLEPLLDEASKATVEVNILAGRAYLNQGDFQQAKRYLERANKQEASNAEVMNLLGVLASYQGDFPTAKKWFLASRTAMGDDKKVKNNLALIAMLEGDFATAKYLLIQLVEDKSAPQKKVRSNLALVYAKLGDKAAFNDLIRQSDRIKKDELFAQLQQVQLVNMSSLLSNSTLDNGDTNETPLSK